MERTGMTKIIPPHTRHFQAMSSLTANLFFSYSFITTTTKMETKCPKTKESLSRLRCARIINYLAPIKNTFLRNF